MKHIVHNLHQKSSSGASLYEKLKKEIARIHGIIIANVDIFSLRDVTERTAEHDLEPDLTSSSVDVRYNCHSSPYYTAARLNGKMIQHKEEVGINSTTVENFLFSGNLERFIV